VGADVFRKYFSFFGIPQQAVEKHRLEMDHDEADRVDREINALSFVFNIRYGSHAQLAKNLMVIFSRPELDAIVFSPINMLLIYGYQTGYQYSLLNTIFGFWGYIDLYMDFMDKTQYIAYKFMEEPAIRITGALPIGRAELLYQSGRIDEALPYLSQGLDESGLNGIVHYISSGNALFGEYSKSRGRR
jgi:hypothetical protein